MAQDPRLKSELLSKANRSLVNSPKNGCSKNKNRKMSRLQSLNPNINTTDIKLKQHRPLRSNDEDERSDSTVRHPFTCQSQLSAHKTPYKPSKLEEAKTPQASESYNPPEVLVDCQQTPTSQVAGGRPQSFPSEDVYEGDYGIEEDYANDNFETPDK